ncbi:MAG TPA: hypothetical protein PK690_11230 [Emcibacteraceae bacterium]|nr:hypothetical protein [Emcibacteraceae bacterium]
MIEIDLLLVGGDQDFNLHRMQKIADSLKVSYRTCYTGMGGIPSINLDVHKNSLIVNGYAFKTKSLFIRPDVMTYQASKNPAHTRLASDWFDILLGWSLANDDIKVLNRNYYVRNKVNKVANLLLAQKLGIKVAETYYTNDVYFMEKHNDGNWIEKPVHGGEHTKMLDMQSKQHNGSGVSMCPITLQKKMMKPEFRFFRVGGSYRAFTMDSPSLDYRENQDAKVEEVPFPEEYKEKFTKLTDILGLDFAAADYISDPETGELCFLEVNSGPMFAAFDHAAGGALCGDIINFLIK